MQEIACFFAFSAITSTKKRTEVRLLFRYKIYSTLNAGAISSCSSRGGAVVHICKQLSEKM